MNYFLKSVPERTVKPRESGLTMVMDKGLSLREVEDMIEVSGEYIDIVKLGWATSYVTPNLDKKIQLYQKAGIPCYLGGTLFEAFVIRDQFEDYVKLVEKYKLEHIEVSDGSITIDHDLKCEYIQKLTKNYTVLSEVGSKDAAKIIPPYKWIEQMQTELDAGAWKVIGEARESGNVGLFRDSGEVRQGLVEEILTKIPLDKILWEAPQKSQQVWFIKLCGTNVNLGNISTNDIIPLETIHQFLQ
jgi:phosphosulfolactate synthase